MLSGRAKNPEEILLKGQLEQSKQGEVSQPQAGNDVAVKDHLDFIKTLGQFGFRHSLSRGVQLGADDKSFVRSPVEKTFLQFT